MTDFTPTLSVIFDDFYSYYDDFTPTLKSISGFFVTKKVRLKYEWLENVLPLSKDNQVFAGKLQVNYSFLEVILASDFLIF